MKMYITTTLLLILALSPAWGEEPSASEKEPSASEKQPSASTQEPSAAKEESTESRASTEETTQAKAQRPPSSAPRPRVPASESQSMTVLADNLSADDLMWLNAGQERFLSLWQQDRSGDPKGALLIIHGEGEHPAWPQTTKPLHDTLPDYGWATLAISLPNPDPAPKPTRTLPVKTQPIVLADNSETQANAADNSDENNSPSTPTVQTAALSSSPQQSSTSQAEQITERRLEAALKFLHDQEQFNIIVLGSGSGAIRAQDFIDTITPKIDNPQLKQNLQKPIRGLIIVNGRNRLPVMAEVYNQWFEDPDIPVLDIFLQSDSRNYQAAQARKVLARQKQVAIYKQVRLSSLSSEKSWGENQLSRRVRSFLDKNVLVK